MTNVRWRLRDFSSASFGYSSGLRGIIPRDKPVMQSNAACFYKCSNSVTHTVARWLYESMIIIAVQRATVFYAVSLDYKSGKAIGNQLIQIKAYRRYSFTTYFYKLLLFLFLLSIDEILYLQIIHFKIISIFGVVLSILLLLRQEVQWKVCYSLLGISHLLE